MRQVTNKMERISCSQRKKKGRREEKGKGELKDNEVKQAERVLRIR